MTVVHPIDTTVLRSVRFHPRVVSLLCLALVWSGAAFTADAPVVWLERMVDVAGKVNFRGTLVHMCGGKVDVVTIVHRVENGRVTERVRSLDADGREIIRDPTEVMCIMPDQQAVMVGPRYGAGRHAAGLLAPAPSFATVNDVNYRLQILAEERVAGQDATVIAIRPTDNYRYGYRLWLDSERAMALKYELIGANGTALEQTLFTEIEYLDWIDAAEVEPTVAMESFVWQDSGSGAISGTAKLTSISSKVNDNAWIATEMPAGFKLMAVEVRSDDETGATVEHLVYSDGLAAVSVFIETGVDAAELQPGVSEMGATNAFTTTFDDYLITAVGGVPVTTAQMIATSVMPAAAGASR